MQNKNYVDEDGWTVTPKKGKSNIKSTNIKFIRKDTNLWYDENSWQHKILTNQLKYEDGKTVSEKFGLDNICKRYLDSKNNFHKNRNFKDLMKVITREVWNEEKVNFEEFNKHEPVKNEQVNIKKSDVEEKPIETEEEVVIEEAIVSEEKIKKINYATSSLIEENKSFASLFKN